MSAADVASAASSPSDEEEMRKLLKPNPSQEQVIDVLTNGYLQPGQTAKILKELDSYDDSNYMVQTDDGTLYLAKIHNGVESQDYVDYSADSVIHFQNVLMDHLNSSGVATSVPIRSFLVDKPAQVNSLPVVSTSHSPKNLVVRLLTWVPGRTMSSLPFLPLETLVDAGQFLGKMDAALDSLDPQEFKAAQRYHAWDGKNLLDVKKYTHCIANEKRRGMVESILNAFQHDIVDPKVPFRTGINQGDFNDANIVVDNEMKVSGVIDFGDSVCRYVS